ncbi:DNAH2 [Branchiostoma lanceolatum]|uniref:DNAH2 protein n=1 Tax=Branchiostoma lanceolatum TaxID=7740 RepID=A0A8K0EWE7_BRALA|nr:DNAH2 [Branchiostoma lanceolatum]
MEVVETSVESLDLGSILPTAQHKDEEDRIDCLEQQLCELQSWFSSMEARLDVSGLHAITCLEDVQDSLARHQAITEQIHDRQRDIDQLLLLCADLLHKPAVRMCSPLSQSFSDASCHSQDLDHEEPTLADEKRLVTPPPEGIVSETGIDNENISSGHPTKENITEADVCIKDKNSDKHRDGAKEEHASHDSSLQQDDVTAQDESLMSVEMMEGEEEEEEGDSLQFLALVLELRWNTVTMAANDIQCRLEEKLNTYKGIYRCTLGPEPQYADESQISQITAESTVEDGYMQGSDVIDSQSVVSLNEEATKIQDIVEESNDDKWSNKSEDGSSEDRATPESNGDVIPFPEEDYEKVTSDDSRDNERDSEGTVYTKTFYTKTTTVEKVSGTVTVVERDVATTEPMSRISTDSLDRIPVRESSLLAQGPDDVSDDSLDDENSGSNSPVHHDDEESSNLPNLHDLDSNTADKEPSAAEDEAERPDEDERGAGDGDHDCGAEDDMDVDSLGSGDEADEASQEEKRRQQQEDELRERLKNACHDKDPLELQAAMEQWREAGMSTDEDIFVHALSVEKELELRNVLRDAVRRRSLTDIEKAMRLVRDQGLADRLRVDMAEAERIAESLRLLESLRHEVLQLNQSTISEIRSYSKPPKPVHKVMLATYLLLGEDASNMKSWQEVRLFIGKTGKENLKRRVQQCDIKKIRPEVARTAKKILSKFDLDQLRDVSAGAAAFFIWAQGMVQEVEERQKDAALEKGAASKDASKKAAP